MKFSDLLNQNTVKQMKHRSNHHAKVNSSHQRSVRNQLAQRRIQHMLTIGEAAKLCGVSKGIIRRWETTGITPNDKMITIKRYAKLLQMNLDQLLKILKG